MTWIENFLILFGFAAVITASVLALRSGRWDRAWERLKKDRVAKICSLVISMYILVGLMDSLYIPGSRDALGRPRTVLDHLFRNVPMEKGYSAPLAKTTYSITKPEPLKGRHLLGTNAIGKDVLLETLKACRTALVIGALSSLIIFPIGTTLGLAAGFFKRRVDDVIQYLYSTFASIPQILLLVSILMVLGRGLPQVAIALGVAGWVGLCRLIRGETMKQSEKAYIEAARALGQSRSTIIFRHLLPNVMHLVLINFILGFSGIVLSEAILSYLGVGAPVGTASWGTMINAARLELAREPAVWWNFAAAIGAVLIFVLSLNLLGDSLRKAFDPKSV
jgi:peptide/nickel transport system permease protein